MAETEPSNQEKAQNASRLSTRLQHYRFTILLVARLVSEHSVCFWLMTRTWTSRIRHCAAVRIRIRYVENTIIRYIVGDHGVVVVRSCGDSVLWFCNCVNWYFLALWHNDSGWALHRAIGQRQGSSDESSVCCFAWATASPKAVNVLCYSSTALCSGVSAISPYCLWNLCLQHGPAGRDKSCRRWFLRRRERSIDLWV